MNKILTNVTEENGRYKHIIQVDGKEFKRNSKKKYSYATLVNENGNRYVVGYSSEKRSAESRARAWDHIGTTSVIELNS